jgi:hypothetical protein
LPLDPTLALFLLSPSILMGGGDLKADGHCCRMGAGWRNVGC